MAIPHRRRTDCDSAGKGLRVLVADDDRNYREFIGQLLRRFDFEIAYASNGLEARSALEECRFDLLVVDCDLPKPDGLELIEEIRATNRHCPEVYALVLTAHEDLDAKIIALRAGFDDFLIKSTPEPEIVAKIGAARRLILRQRRLDTTVRELYGLATRDELTGLYNRRYFFGEADRLLSEGLVVNLVLFDLDRFKDVNDTYGHLAGDRLLRDVGALFIARTRHQDIIARYGGDEFVLLVASAAIEEVEHIAGRIARELAGLEWTFDDDLVQIGVTTGLASSALLDRPTVAQLIDAGDRDLYKNKWIRSHPGLDPGLYEYPTSRAVRISRLVEFPSGGADVRKASFEA